MLSNLLPLIIQLKISLPEITIINQCLAEPSDRSFVFDKLGIECKYRLKNENILDILLHIDTWVILKLNYKIFLNGSAKVTGGPPGLQIRCGALKPSQVGSIPMHFRQLIL